MTEGDKGGLKPTSKLPWMKFYPTDWRADPGLRACSLTARGLWIEMLAIMHEAVPYGHLMYTPDQLERIVGAKIDDLLEELECADVFSRNDEGVIYSRRMVRDRQHSEKQSEYGRRGGNPDLLKGGLKGGDKPRSQKSELESERKTLGASAPEFDAFFKAYPRRSPHSNPRKPALLKFEAARKRGVDPQAMIAGAKALAVSTRGTDPKFIPQAVTWLSQERWADVVEKPPQGSGPIYVDNGPTVTL